MHATARQTTTAPAASTTTQYDQVGNPLMETDPVGNQTKHDYDALNRLTVTTYADGTTTQAATGAAPSQPSGRSEPIRWISISARAAAAHQSAGRAGA